MLYKIKRFFEYLKKVCQYAIILWDDYDWDSSFTLELLKFKLTRLYHTMEQDKFHEVHKELKSLRVALRLLDKILSYGREELPAYTRFDIKWGQLQHEETLLPDGNYSLRFYRDNAPTPELDNQMRKEMLSLYLLQEQQYARNKRLFFNILAKHMDSWWV